MSWIKEHWIILVAILTSLVVGGALGKHFGATTTEKVVTKEIIKEVIVKEEVEKKSTTKENKEVKEGPVKETIVIKRPDGTTEEHVIETGPKETKVITDNSSEEKSTKETKETTKEKTTEVTSPRPNWGLGVQAHYAFGEIIHQEYYKVKPLVSGGYRLFGNLWLEGSSLINPSQISSSTAGLGFKIEW